MVVEMLAGGAKKDTKGSLFRKGEGLCIRLSDGGRSLVGVVAGAAAITEAGAELIIDHTLIVTGFRADEDTDLFRRHGIDISPVCNQTLAQIRLRKGVVDSGIQPIDDVRGSVAWRQHADPSRQGKVPEPTLDHCRRGRDRQGSSWQRDREDLQLASPYLGQGERERCKVEVDLPVDDCLQGGGGAVARDVIQTSGAAQAKQLGAELACG